jgi:hypothetical protein
MGFLYRLIDWLYRAEAWLGRLSAWAEAENARMAIEAEDRWKTTLAGQAGVRKEDMNWFQQKYEYGRTGYINSKNTKN